MEKYVLEKLKGNPYVANILEKWHDDFNVCIRMEYLKGGELFKFCKYLAYLLPFKFLAFTARLKSATILSKF